MPGPGKRRFSGARATALGDRDRELLEEADLIIGIDEVGRGALAGPVVVGAAAFTAIPKDPAIRDSKRLSPRLRTEAVGRLGTICANWLVCEVWVELIDRMNILEATRLAMGALARTLVQPGAVVVTDYVDPGNVGCPVLALKKADEEFFSVAAASIIAKVHRDRVMTDLGRYDPRWEWDKNKGYGTSEHRRALQQHGINSFHRRSFRWSPVLP
ncbi:MAG: ribonuclease HII [Thermoanaerobaculales bacterium]